MFVAHIDSVLSFDRFAIKYNNETKISRKRYSDYEINNLKEEQ